MVFRHLKNTVFSKGLNSPQNALVDATPGAEADMIRFRSGYFRFLLDISSISPIFAPPKKALLQ
jgi:hypothetical protein